MDLTTLIPLAVAGDSQAQMELYEAYYKRAYYLALRLTKNESDAEDATQEAFLSVFKNLEKLENPKAFQGWLFQIVANRCNDIHRKTGATEELPEGFDEHEPDRDEGFLPEAVLQNKEKQRLIMQMIQALPEEQKQCILLFYYSELSVKQVAETLGVSEGTVKSRLNYARQKIKDAVLTTEEKEGIRLHSLAPFTLLFALDFQSVASSVAVATFGGATAATATTATTATGAGTTAATATASTKATVLATVQGKVIAGALAASLAVGGVALVNSGPEVVEFQDEAMAHNISILLDIPVDEITTEDLEGVSFLSIFDDGICFYDDGSAVEGSIPISSLDDLNLFPDLETLLWDVNSAQPLHDINQDMTIQSLYIRPIDEEVDLSFLQSFPQLTLLALSFGAYTNESFLEQVDTLEYLSITNSRGISLDLSALSNLTHLFLSTNTYKSIPYITISGTDALSNLMVFNCDGTLTDFTPLLAMTNLKVLSLCTYITEEDLQSLSCLQNLQALFIHQKAGSDSPLIDLSFLAEFTQLKAYYIEDSASQCFYNAPSSIPNDYGLYHEAYQQIYQDD